ncbi:MAG TPA: hypothetical protein VE287_04755, partial [Actinopolymorphaceae bacterium]|nr:hypothetical protein [Actinopolymorphaceae bacterium]
MRRRHASYRIAVPLTGLCAGLMVVLGLTGGSATAAPTRPAGESGPAAATDPTANAGMTDAVKAGITGAAKAGVTDVVRFGDAGSEDAHEVRASAGSAAVHGTVEAGQLTEPYAARSVRSGGSFTASLRVDPGQPLTLQVKEVRPDDGWGRAYGFRVLLDGIPFYVRDPATQDAGAGPYSSFFLETADPTVLADGRVDVTVEGTSVERAYVAEVWAYSDLSGMVHDQGMRAPDRMVFVLGQDHRGETYFRSRLDYVAAAIHESPDVGRGMAVLDYFANRTPAQMDANYQLWLRLSREYGIPFGIESTSDWEGTPGSVPDGKGGTFGDVKYQQVLWSPQDQTGPDKDVWKGQRLDDLLGARY